jgi:hypothetical protein
VNVLKNLIQCYNCDFYLLNNAVKTSTLWSNERMVSTIVVKVKVIPRHLSGGIEENHGTPQSG